MPSLGPEVWHDLRLAIGGLVISVVAPENLRSVVANTVYGRFISSEPSQVSIRLHSSGPLSPIAESKGWGTSPSPFTRVHRRVESSDGRCVLSVESELEGRPFKLLAIFEDGFGRGDIYSVPPVGADILFYHLGYYWLTLLLANLLGRRCGAFLHACGIALGQQGILFAGPSGSGKSTLACIARGLDEAVVLNDELVIVRQIGGQYRIFSLPWTGNWDWVSVRGVPLARIFFIRHGEQNRCYPKDRACAAKELLAQPFLSLLDRESIQGVLNFVAELSQTVPCYDLEFVPDRSAVDFIRGMLP